MSVITDVIVFLAYTGNKDIDRLLLEADLGKSSRPQHLTRLDEDLAGGGKWMTSQVYAAAVNYADVDLDDWFRALPWHAYDRALLAWDREGDTGAAATPAWGDPADEGWGPHLHDLRPYFLVGGGKTRWQGDPAGRMPWRCRTCTRMVWLNLAEAADQGWAVAAS